MDLRTLRYFTVVANELNITHAAQKLRISQPPLSHQMQLLEQELGAQLFVRGKRRLKLTDEGEALLRRANELLELAEKTREEIREMKNGVSGTLSVALVEGRAPFLAARWIAGFNDEFPAVRYSLWNGSSDEAIRRLEKGLADIAVIASPFDNEKLEGLVVGNEPWVAIIPRNNPLASCEGDTVRLKDLAGQPVIVPSRKSRVQAVYQWFAETGSEPEILCELSNYVDAIALSEQGVGISIFPQTTYTPNDLVVTKVITEPARRAEYVLVWLKGRESTALSREFINYVRDFMADNLMNTERFGLKKGRTALPKWESLPPILA